MLRKILAASSAVVLGVSFQGCSSKNNDNCANWPDSTDTTSDDFLNAEQECVSCLASKAGISVDFTSDSATCEELTDLVNQFGNCDDDTDSASYQLFKVGLVAIKDACCADEAFCSYDGSLS
jgi:hypothetical protein